MAYKQKNNPFKKRTPAKFIDLTKGARDKAMMQATGGLLGDKKKGTDADSILGKLSSFKRLTHQDIIERRRNRLSGGLMGKLSRRRKSRERLFDRLRGEAMNLSEKMKDA